MLLDVDRTLKGGTLKALVERLTTHDQPGKICTVPLRSPSLTRHPSQDPPFTKAFLMTFKSFTTPEELFDVLVERFRIQPPPKLDPAEHQQWVQMKQRVIQARYVFSGLRIDRILIDPQGDQHLQVDDHR